MASDVLLALSALAVIVLPLVVAWFLVSRKNKSK